MNRSRLRVDVWLRATRWRRAASVPWVLCVLCVLSPAVPANSQALTEYRLKAAFLYNFSLFTEWPSDTGSALNLCVYGGDPFGEEIDALQGKPVGVRLLAVHRIAAGESLADCQIVFMTASTISRLPNVLDELHGHAVLTVADSSGAARRGVAINMSVQESKVSFEANLAAARRAGVNLSSKLLRLATQVIQ